MRLSTSSTFFFDLYPVPPVVLALFGPRKEGGVAVGAAIAASPKRVKGEVVISHESRRFVRIERVEAAVTVACPIVSGNSTELSPLANSPSW